MGGADSALVGAPWGSGPAGGPAGAPTAIIKCGDEDLVQQQLSM